MFANQRQMKIYLLLREEGQAKVSYLSQKFAVSEPTVRQDLAKLESEGLVIREHGGAYLKNMSEKVRTLSLEHKDNMTMKAAIGRKAATLINDGDSLIIDSGSTTTEIAKNMTSMSELMVVTSALNIALLLGTNSEIKILMPGGEFLAHTLSLTGARSANFFEEVHVEKLFLAAHGISHEAGVTTPGFNDLAIKKSMISSAEKIYLTVDSTKIDNTSFAVICGLSKIDYLITDSGITSVQKRKLENAGIEVIVADDL